MTYYYLDEIDTSANADTFYEGMVSTEANFLLLDNEVYDARGSCASVGTRLSGSINADGTPIATPSTAVDWVASGSTPTYVGTTSFTVPTDVSAIYTVGRKLKIALGASTVYNIVLASAYTTVTTITVATANITNLISGVSYGQCSTDATGGNPAQSYLVAKTADYTVTHMDLFSGITFTNTGAAGAVNFTLPAGVNGYKASFAVTVAQYLKFTANGTEKFRYLGTQGAAGGYVRINIIGRMAIVEWLGSEWGLSLVGEWNYDQ